MQLTTTIKKFINDLITEDDGVTYCISRVIALTSVGSYISGASLMLYKCQPLLLTDFANGFAILMAGAGALIALKASTQKVKPSENTSASS